jgi:hypothetical protein
MWSIYLKPEKIINGSELYFMTRKFPEAACHDGENYIFVETHPKADNPILVTDLVDENGDQLVGAALGEELKYQVFIDGRTRPIHLRKEDAKLFHSLPEWQLWIGDDKDNDSETAKERVDEYSSKYEAYFPAERKINRIPDYVAQREDTLAASREAIREKYRLMKITRGE